jgi:hypothetical protein
MTMRPILIAALLLMGGPVAAADYHAPRNAAGQPDLQGVWNTHFALPLEARPDTPNLTLPKAEAQAFLRRVAVDAGVVAATYLDPESAEIAQDPARSGPAIVRGQIRTHQVVQPADGKLPLTSSARSRYDAIQATQHSLSAPPTPADGPEARLNMERCLVGFGQPPVASVADTSPRQIIQTPDAVVILAEYGPDLRIIPFTDKHGPTVQASTLGDSIAHWEGETLVVETIGLPAKDRIRILPTLFVPATATVTERFTRLSKTELLYQYTVVDPSVYTAPWLAEYSLERTDKPILEFACHEGNYSLPNILAGARRQEREALRTGG